ncbi:MAG TPA: alpha/beta hydrolase [Anaerolineales bacterium]|nr:alpha/beta hydrolase [Anaerolineae bacterium]HIQ00760.1 alpha/beta hydrolase [Anaerolineales bacterium]
MEHSEGTFQGAGGLELYYQRWRPEREPRAVLAIVHGFGEHSGRYTNVVNHLVGQGYAIYGFDHRGHGQSPGQRGYIHEWGEFREDVRAFLRMVGEGESGRPLFLMGHSLGGLIVLEYALRHPEGLRGVIASGPALGQVGISPILLSLSRILSRVWPRLSMDTGLDATAISRDPAVVRAYQEDPLVHSKGTPRLGTEMTKAIEWVQAHAADLRLPLLILQGEADRLVPPEAGRAFFEKVTFPDKEWRGYEGGYHEPHNDITRDQALSDLTGWLERHL